MPSGVILCDKPSICENRKERCENLGEDLDLPPLPATREAENGGRAEVKKRCSPNPSRSFLHISYLHFKYWIINMTSGVICNSHSICKNRNECAGKPEEYPKLLPLPSMREAENGKRAEVPK